MEIDLRLDPDGRTAYNPSSTSNENKNDNDNTSHDDDNAAPLMTIDYRPKAVIITNLIPSLTTTTTMTTNNDIKNNNSDDGNKMTNDTTCHHHDDSDGKTSSPSIPLPTTTTTTTTKKSKLDELLYDCEIADCGILPRTFWMDVRSKPRCALEKLALSIFHHHITLPSSSTPQHHYDPHATGVEWWVQIRPSPSRAGRYAMLSPSTANNNGISFHWDKDEELRLLTGGSLYVHPHLSTVTYLTDVGAPTVVVPMRVDQQSGRILPLEKKEEEEVLCSWPRGGKHLSFDGRFLHAAPVDVVRSDDDFFSRDGERGEEEEEERRRRRRRVTFLVNLWVNYKPLGVEPFPASMVGRLSPVDVLPDDAWGGRIEEDLCDCVVGKETEEEEEGNDGSSSSSSSSKRLRTFTWPLGGGCDDGNDDSIEMDLPIDVIQEQGRVGTRGTVRIVWNDGDKKGVRIVKRTMSGETTAGTSVRRVTGERHREDKKQRVDE